MYQFRDPKLHACLNKYACQVQEKNMQVVQIFYTNYMYNHLYNCSVLYKFELKVDGWQLLPTTLEMTTKPCSFNMCCFVTYTFWVEVLFEQPGIVSCLKNVCCIALESMWAIPLAQHMFDLIYVWSCKKLVKCICDFPLLKVISYRQNQDFLCTTLWFLVLAGMLVSLGAATIVLSELTKFIFAIPSSPPNLEGFP